MGVGPFVVGVSELRRHLADLIDQVGRGKRPLFITQYGFVTAVLISRKQYQEWCPDGEASRHTGGERRHAEHTSRSGEFAGGASRLRPLGDTVLPTRRIWTQYGWCDFESAQVLAEQGVETELVLTDQGWLTDDEG